MTLTTPRFAHFLPAAALALTALSPLASAQSIPVPNSSFELQIASGTPAVSVFIDSWQKNLAEPAYFTPIGQMFQIPWYGTTGVFLDTTPYANRLGTQAGYLLDFTEVELFQDFSTTPAFNASYEVGKSYELTLGVFAKNMSPASTLRLGLYYLNGANEKVIVDTTDIAYSSTTFVNSGSRSLVDFTVAVPAVQAGDAWAGKHIGIQLLVTTPNQAVTGGNWDVENARLTAVPEPGTLSALALGLSGLLATRRRSRSNG